MTMGNREERIRTGNREEHLWSSCIEFLQFHTLRWTLALSWTCNCHAGECWTHKLLQPCLLQLRFGPQFHKECDLWLLTELKLGSMHLILCLLSVVTPSCGSGSCSRVPKMTVQFPSQTISIRHPWQHFGPNFCCVSLLSSDQFPHPSPSCWWKRFGLHFCRVSLPS